MLSRLTNLIKGDSDHPSAVLTLEAFPEIQSLHIVEDGTAEFINYSKERTFSFADAKELSREQLGAVALRVGAGETLRGFLEEVYQRARQNLTPGDPLGGGEHERQHFADTVEQALRSATLSCVHDRENQASDLSAAQSYPVFLVRINRARPGRLRSREPRSIGNW